MSYPRRDVVDAIRCLLRTGCQWDALPVDFPPAPLVKHYVTVWTRDGTLNRPHNTLREHLRQVEGRTPDPTGALIDSQTVRAAETVPRASRGYDSGKQDRNAGRLLIWILNPVFPTIRHVWADGGYAGKLVDHAATMLGITVGECGDGQAAVDLARRLRPDVVVMDLRMPVLDGIKATHQLAGAGVAEPVKVLVVTTFNLDEYVSTRCAPEPADFCSGTPRRPNCCTASGPSPAVRRCSPPR